MIATASRRGLLACTAIASATLLPMQALAQEADDAGGLTEIIVTAQKREQSVQDVPIAVTAVDQETLQANRIMTVNDLGSIAPGVTVRPSAGGVQVPSFTMRGQNSFGVVAGSDKQVSIYLDGVYIAAARGSIFDLPDISRLEVLRGPQGTLFGRNATAGAINVVTRDPTGDPRVKAVVGIGNRNGQHYRVSADLPQIGPFSAYFSFMRNYRHGEVRNAAAGMVWDRSRSPQSRIAVVTTSPKWLGTIDTESYFGAIKFEPSDSFKTVYKFDRNDDSGTPDANALTYYNPAALAGPLAPLAGLIGPAFATNNLYLNTGNRRPDIVFNGWSVPRDQRVYGHSLTSTWQATDSITVKNVASYRKTFVFAPSVIDGIGGLTYGQAAIDIITRNSLFASLGGGDIAAGQAIFNTFPPANQAGALAQTAAGLAAAGIGPNNRLLLFDSQANSISRQWSDEIQVNYTSDRLQLTAGLLWFRAKSAIGGPEGMINTFQFSVAGIRPDGLLPLGNEGRYFNKDTSIAAYAQAEYKMTDELELVLGGRVTKDRKSSRFRWDNVINGVIVPRADIVPPVYKNTKPNWLIGLNWTPNEDTLVYAKFSTSFVSGGSVAGIDFVPETATSFELGLKADMLDRRLRTNLALFDVHYKHFQQPSSTTSAEAVAFLVGRYGALGQVLAGNLSTFVQQAHDVKARGVELEVTAAPTDGLTLGGGLAYTDTKFTNIDPVFLAAQGGAYTSFVRPKWTGNAYASYETQPLFGEARLALRVDGLYRSALHFSGREALLLSRGIPRADLVSPGNWSFNARAALKDIAIGGVRGELAAWGRNLTNNKYATSNIQFGVINAGNYEPARTYGIDFSIEF